ncbi:MAG: FAD-linked oxidase C-terminal domain-containing protein [Myxococcota bacterium]
MPQRTNSLETFLARLGPAFGDRLRTDAEALSLVAGDESDLPPGSPAAALWPESSDEVVLIAREAGDLGVPLVPRGAGTGKAGGCIPASGEVVVDLSRMNRILELRPQDLYAEVEPGVITRDLDLAAGEVGFFYPPDPASLESCTIGGNIATNAGGSRAVKYGVTHRYAWGVELVLSGGTVMRLGRRSIKGVAGLDLRALVVGSEGTLGFVTRATMHIVPAPEAVETAWLTFDDALTASRAAEKIFAAGFLPRMMELLDARSLEAVRPVSPMALPERGGAAILLEVDGAEEEAPEELLRIAALAVDAGAVESAIAKNEKEREAMRRTRRLVSSSLKEKFPFKISDDIAVPRSRMPELLERAREEGEAAGLVVSAYGHLGDGNVHVNLLCATQEERQTARAVRRRILAIAVDMGGTVSGEHGIGMAKRDQLLLELSEDVVDLQRRLKRVFDPTGIMNPGKVYPPA